jgi:DNA-binding CsgD family transcriptional regulator
MLSRAVRTIKFNTFHPDMSDRMAETAALVALGRINKEIADEMGVSIKTVQKFREMINYRFGTRNTADITRLAIWLGIINLDEADDPRWH